MAIGRYGYLIFVICCSLVTISCWRPGGVGIGGRYLDAKAQVTTLGGNLNKAISNLEYVVGKDPFYEDSLTLLGRAYYKSKRYREAFQFLKRALAVNPKDEIAWIALGLTQLRLGDDEAGLGNVKGGLTLLANISKDGYKDLDWWDKNGLVRSSLRKAIFYAAKGLEDKRRVIRTGEILLARIDDEEWIGTREARSEEIEELMGN